MVKVLRVGILGAGFISRFHIQSLLSIPHVSIESICDEDMALARAMQDRYKIPAVFRTLEGMLRHGPLDVVHVLTPPLSHARNAIACLEAGSHVFIEKPVATSSDECRELARAAAASERLIGVNQNACYHPAFRQAMKHIQECRIGEVQYVQATVNLGLRQLQAGQHSHWMFRSPGNIILEQAVHPLTQIRMLVGGFEKISPLVSGEVKLNTGEPFFETWQISMLCRRGAAHCFLSLGTRFPEHQLNIIGGDGAISVDLLRNTVSLLERTRFIDPADRLIQAGNSGVRMIWQGVRNFKDYASDFLRRSSTSNPFANSIHESISSFYGALSRDQVPPDGLEDAAEVISACETIAAGAQEQVATFALGGRGNAASA